MDGRLDPQRLAHGQKKPVENVDLWKRVETLMANRIAGITHVKWVKGHAGHPMNERADATRGRSPPGGRAWDERDRRGSAHRAGGDPALTFVRRRQSDVPARRSRGTSASSSWSRPNLHRDADDRDPVEQAGPYAEIEQRTATSGPVAARPVLEGMADAVRRTGRGLDGDAVKAVLIAVAAHDMTSEASAD